MAAISSILAVDFGNVNTRALLIDLVDGVYTLVAQAKEPTTAGFPAGDVTLSLGRVARQMSAITGRAFLGENNRLIMPEGADRSGVDAFIATASIGRPLKTVIIGLVAQISIASGVRAAAGTYVNIVGTYSLDNIRSPEDTLNSIVLSRPDLIFIVGGMEGGAREPVLELAQIVRLSAAVMHTRPPLIIYAGNNSLTKDIQALFEGITDVFIADNVRPTFETEILEPAQLELALAYNTFAAMRGMGFDTVASLTKYGVLPNAQSYHLVVDYLGRVAERGQNVLAVDIGAANCTLSAWVNNKATTSIRTDIGLGQSAHAALAAVGLESVRQWLPFVTYDDEITAYALNKSLRPTLIPDTLRAMYLEHGLLRAALNGLLQSARPAWSETALDDPNEPLPPFARIIAAGAGLADTGRPGMTAMLLLDAIQPAGVTRLQLDSAGLIPALGALARLSPEAAVQLVDGSGIEDLCMAISLNGQPRAGKTAAKVQVALANGTTETYSIEGGALWVYDLSQGANATVTIQAARGLSINGKRKVKLKVEGGTAGLIIDARGRPIPLAADTRALAEQISNWYAQATGDPIREVSVEWLEDVITANLAGISSEADAPKKRGRRGKTDSSADLPEVPVAEPFASGEVSTSSPKKSKKKPPSSSGIQQLPGDEIQGLSDDDLRNLLS
jgi:hypothetical protein